MDKIFYLINREIRRKQKMYAGWTVEKKVNGGNNKYYPLTGSQLNEVGVIQKNGFSSPLYCLDGQLVAVRNFGQNKTSAPKIQNLVNAGKITIISGTCLFSRSQFGIIDTNREFHSLAIPHERKYFSSDEILALKIGEVITKYHEFHLSFVEKLIKNITDVTKINPDIKLVIPGIEYMTYIPDSWPNGLKEEYWEKITKGGELTERFYKKRIQPLGDLEIIRKKEWDVPVNGDNYSRDVKSYVKTYTDANSSGLIIAIEDLTELPLVVKAGKQLPNLIGVLGVLASPKDLFEKEEEIHPYFL